MKFFGRYPILWNGGGTGEGTPPAPSGPTQAELDAVKAQIAALTTERDDFKAKVEAAESAKLSDIEKAQRERDAVKAELTAAQEAVKAANLRGAIEREARKLNIVDDEVAYRLLDLAAVQFDKDGKPANVPALLADLVKQKPFLVATQEQKTTGGGPTNPPRNKNGGTLTMDDIKKMSASEINARWDDVQAVLKGG